jgi:hypothetical protein
MAAGVPVITTKEGASDCPLRTPFISASTTTFRVLWNTLEMLNRDTAKRTSLIREARKLVTDVSTGKNRRTPIGRVGAVSMKNSGPDVSVIVVNFNTRDLLEACLRTLKNNTSERIGWKLSSWITGRRTDRRIW